MISRDVSATMCDVMMTLVSMKTRLKTQGLFDPSEVCAYRGQTVYCTTELCLSVDKRKKTTNKEGTMLVYRVYVMYILSHVETWEYHPAENDYRCKSLINSKTISVSKKFSEIIFAGLINSKNIMSA